MLPLCLKVPFAGRLNTLSCPAASPSGSAYAGIVLVVKLALVKTIVVAQSATIDPSPTLDGG